MGDWAGNGGHVADNSLIIFLQRSSRAHHFQRFGCQIRAMGVSDCVWIQQCKSYLYLTKYFRHTLQNSSSLAWTTNDTL